jgi:hypothetical protein
MMSAREEFAAAIEEMEKPVLEFTELRNPAYTLLVYKQLCGQFRIQLTDKLTPDPTAPEGHGSIVCQLDTYYPAKAVAAAAMLSHAEDPLALARSWARPYNCDGVERDRIRLDNVPGNRGTKTGEGSTS